MVRGLTKISLRSLLILTLERKSTLRRDLTSINGGGARFSRLTRITVRPSD